MKNKVLLFLFATCFLGAATSCKNELEIDTETQLLIDKLGNIRGTR